MNVTASVESRARKALDSKWQEVQSLEKFNSTDSIDEAIDRVFDHKEVGYKKLIISQAAAKVADPSLDAHSLQKGDGRVGAFDAREFAKKVFVPWNRDIGCVLGDAADPYVGNQFRAPRFDRSIREQRRSKKLFDDTFEVIKHIEKEGNKGQAAAALSKVLLGLRRYLQGRSFDYALPHRASIEAVEETLREYLDVKSGGARLQAVAHALVASLADAGLPFSDLLSDHVNSSDTSSNRSGDISGKKGALNWAAEIKDRKLDVAEVSASITKARVAGVTELLFLVQARSGSIFKDDEEEDQCRELANREFRSGLNSYFFSFFEFAIPSLAILAEDGRRTFLRKVGEALENQKVDSRHRWAWAKMVREL